ncbi:MAG: hypothetical protein HRU36_01255 [Rickettsiales bacterium]|nr:hypothetical protein [Rickettsiales bacterium]
MKAKTFFGALLDGVSGDLQNSSIEAKILGDHLLYGRFREARIFARSNPNAINQYSSSHGVTPLGLLIAKGGSRNAIRLAFELGANTESVVASWRSFRYGGAESAQDLAASVRHTEALELIRGHESPDISEPSSTTLMNDASVSGYRSVTSATASSGSAMSYSGGSLTSEVTGKKRSHKKGKRKSLEEEAIEIASRLSKEDLVQVAERIQAKSGKKLSKMHRKILQKSSKEELIEMLQEHMSELTLEQLQEGLEVVRHFESSLSSSVASQSAMSYVSPEMLGSRSVEERELEAAIKESIKSSKKEELIRVLNGLSKEDLIKLIEATKDSSELSGIQWLFPSLSSLSEAQIVETLSSQINDLDIDAVEAMARLVEEVGVSVGRSGAPTYAPSIVVAADYDDISIVPTPSPTERPEVLEESSPLEGPTIANELQFSDQRSSNESDNNVEEAIPGTVALGITFGGSDVL